MIEGMLKLQRWLRGFGYEPGLLEFVKQFPEAKHKGIIYRGMSFKDYPYVSDIHNSEFCSWTTDIKVAEYFASHDRYGVVLSKQSYGYDIHKILKIAAERGVCPQSLINYRTKASEKEIVDSLDMRRCRLRRTGCN